MVVVVQVNVPPDPIIVTPLRVVLLVGRVDKFQVIPSGLHAVWPLVLIATNIPEPYVSEFHVPVILPILVLVSTSSKCISNIVFASVAKAVAVGVNVVVYLLTPRLILISSI